MTSGSLLAGLGTLAIVMSLFLVFVWRVELRFIDERAMGFLGVLFVALGTWMVIHGRRLDNPP